MVDEHTLFDFYDDRVGEGVVSGAHFDTWWKQERRRRPDLLTFDPAMLVQEGADAITGADYPDVWQEGSLSLPVRYHFEPGHESDGVTVDVPLATLNQVDAAPFTWQVPGLREELVTALIRSLPKPLRVNFVPAPNVARGFLDAVPPGEEPLTDALARHLRAPDRRARAAGGVGVVEGARCTCVRGSASWRTTARWSRRDETSTRSSGRCAPASTLPWRRPRSTSGIARSGETTWAFGTIEPSFTQVRAGHEVQGFPTLVDEGDAVGLRVVGSADEQEARHRLGVRRLVALQVPSPAKPLLDGLDNATKLGLAGSPYPTVAALVDDVVLAVFGDLVDARDPVRDEASYDALLAAARAEVEQRSRDLLLLVGDVLARWRATHKALTGRVDLPLLPAMNDLRGQLDRLVRAGFVVGGRGEPRWRRTRATWRRWTNVSPGSPPTRAATAA